MDYPNDADGDALRRIAAAGNDMSLPMAVDFEIAASEQSAVEAVAEAADKLGYDTEIFVLENEDEDDAEPIPDPWTCECTKDMVLTHESVLKAQQELNAIAKPLGAYADGWGTFGNVESDESDIDEEE